MIEVNKKAKPFHPCEEYLGTELLWNLKKAQLIGRNYYAPKHPTNNIDILALFKSGNGFSWTSKALQVQGFIPKPLGWQSVAQFTRHTRKTEERELNVLLAHNAWSYDAMVEAQEICKYIQLYAHEGRLLEKQMVIDMHCIIIDGWKLKMGADGAFGFEVPPQEVPEPAVHAGHGLAAGAHLGAAQWAAQAQHVDAAAIAAQQVQLQAVQQNNIAQAQMDMINNWVNNIG